MTFFTTAESTRRQAQAQDHHTVVFVCVSGWGVLVFLEPFFGLVALSLYSWSFLFLCMILLSGVSRC